LNSEKKAYCPDSWGVRTWLHFADAMVRIVVGWKFALPMLGW
jgi:hypothetical protein